jgi:hypothetical protein
MPALQKIYSCVKMDSGALDIPIPGVVDVRNFQKGLYRCGKVLSSPNAARTLPDIQ